MPPHHRDHRCHRGTNNSDENHPVSVCTALGWRRGAEAPNGTYNPVQITLIKGVSTPKISHHHPIELCGVTSHALMYEPAHVVWHVCRPSSGENDKTKRCGGGGAST